MAKIVSPRRRKPDRVPILVVEDNADQWLIIRSALAQCFPEVEPVWMNSSSQTTNYLENCLSDESKLPKLILADLYLPRSEDGWSLLEFIKSHSVYQQIPTVVLSASNDDEDRAKTYRFGIASYIVKPGSYHQWLNCFYIFRRYWWEVVTLTSRS